MNKNDSSSVRASAIIVLRERSSLSRVRTVTQLTYVMRDARCALIVDLYPREQWLSRSHKASREGELNVKK